MVPNIPTSRLFSLGFLFALVLGCTQNRNDTTSGLSQGKASTRPDENSIINLDQGWSTNERQDFYFLTQGSQLVPYFWFLALEQPDSKALFRSDRHLASLGYIPSPPEAQRNPDGLPIGFVKDDNPETVMMGYSIKKEFLGPNYSYKHYPSTNVWLGFTCAACHTAEITYQGKMLRIDGGPAMADHERFLNELVQALRATSNNDEKFTRFAKRVLQTGYNSIEAQTLEERVGAYTEVLERLVLRNRGNLPHGFGRLDAFGAILNQITEVALAIPENHRPADAPVSYPFLWNTPHLDWVQWNGSVDNPLRRNVGEVLGVYAHLKLTGTPSTGQFISTVRINHLFHLEQLLTKLTAPEWPEDILGVIDQEKAAFGKQLFAANCAQCHGVRDKNGQFPMGPPNRAGKRFIGTKLISYKEIGTDPKMVQNFIKRDAQPGALRPFLSEEFRDREKVPAAELLRVAVQEVIQNHLASIQPSLDKDQLVALNGYRDSNSQPPNLTGYKARPLDGIWATAPYLHNGSVPNLYQLLLPEEQRMKSFSVGSRAFEPVNVGFRTDKFEGRFVFKTQTADGQPIPGNSNAGHSGEFYTQRADRRNGILRDFTDEERWALVEYMKTLK